MTESGPEEKILAVAERAVSELRLIQSQLEVTGPPVPERIAYLLRELIRHFDEIVGE